MIHQEVVYPDVEKLHEERRELFRIAGVNALKHRQNLDVNALRWAEHMAMIKPLGRPLSDGSPTDQCCNCGRSGHLAKDCKWRSDDSRARLGAA